MHILYIDTFDDWRNSTRQLIANDIHPSYVEWNEVNTAQSSLFNNIDQKNDGLLKSRTSCFSLSQNFIKFAQIVSYHSDPVKWQLLYNAVWRLTHGERHLMQLATDPLVHQLMVMRKAVGRDAHKMKAFVRFRLFINDSIEYYIAYYRPDHKIVKYVAPFFKRRFAIMNWAIITPHESVFWNGNSLEFNLLDSKFSEKSLNDDTEFLWQTYYRAIFNPARIKIKAMRREMPIRYWQNMPETKIIDSMLLEAPVRVDKMLNYVEGSSNNAEQYLPAELTLENLQSASIKCKGCSLYQCATQTVFGAGYTNANIMIVGEQPGDLEDKLGMPFKGPAGDVLDDILKKLNLSRHDIYITNTVKHFKFKSINGKRLHVSPSTKEIIACKPWLEAEIKLINPKIIICLGVTAARALISYGFYMKKMRGKLLQFSEHQQIIATYHPSAVLRAVNSKDKLFIYQTIINDIVIAVNTLNS